MSFEENVPNEQLRRARHLKGWTQSELAEALDTDFETVSRWERGVNTPSSYFREKLCHVLNSTPQELGLISPHIHEPLVPSPSRCVYLAASYTDAGSEFTTRLKMYLQAQGVTVLSSRTLRGQRAENPQKALQASIRTAQSIIFIASPEARTSRHVQHALHIARIYQSQIYAVWIAGERLQECVPKDSSEFFATIDVREQHDQHIFAEIFAALEKAWLARSSTSGDAKSLHKTAQLPFEPRNPYKGLKAFQREDQDDYFGRDTLVNELVGAIHELLISDEKQFQNARLLTVIGPSGSGKSSVVMAGLLPRLQQGALPGSEEWIYLDPIVPGAHPIESLSLALAAQLPGRSLLTIHQDLEEDSTRGLHQLVTALTRFKNTRVLLCVDQFEELFTQTSSLEEREHFLELLVTALTEPRGPLIAILTLRADFYDRVLSSSDLGQLVEQHHCAVFPMNIQELRMVIEQPAKLADVQVIFEGDLVADLLFEMQGQAEALPLLQFTLDQLFRRRCDRQLTLEAYHEIGGVKGALVGQAESTYASLPYEEHRRLAQVMFLRLIEPGATEQETSRRRAARTELELSDPTDTVILKEVIEAFIQARLVTSTSVAGTAVLEVSHEALIREWPRLINWLQEAREDILLQHTISEDAANWLERGKSNGRLYRRSQLVEALSWSRRNCPSKNELAFLQASQRKHLQYNIGMLSIVLLLLASVGLAGWYRWQLPPDPTRVTTLQDSGTGSLRWAIDNAPTGSTITFEASLKGTLRLTNRLLIDKRLSIRGPGTVVIKMNGNRNDEDAMEIPPTGSVTITSLAFTSSSLYNAGTLTLINSTISGSAALPSPSSPTFPSSGYPNGGGIYNQVGGILTLINSTVSGNYAEASGGGIFNSPNATLTLINSTISNNRADTGAGISNDGGTLTLINSTISDNRAEGQGGGILNGGTNAQTELIFCTIYGNTSGEEGGGIWNGAYNIASQLLLKNSLVGGNKAPAGPDILGHLTSEGYNLIQSTKDTTFASNQLHATDLFQVASAALGIDPLLRDNDGSTQTHALLPSSVAIDRIPPNNCRIKDITTDQRGVRRPQGMACDIGAYELLQ